ncbi:MAG: universal stress protein [Bacteroidales bacterium]|nr:universal stress protein [Bacteroidales bacterium]
MNAKNIIVGTDFSKGSYVALDVATDIANKLIANIELIWVCKEKNLFSDEQTESLRGLAMEKLSTLAKEYGKKLTKTTIEWKVLDGKVATVIAKEAERINASMIVIGTNGASGFEKYWMGSTAVRIVQEANCPTLSIREGFNYHKNLERIVAPLNMTENSRQKIPVVANMAKIFGSTVHLLGLIEQRSEESTIDIYLHQAEKYLSDMGIPFVSEKMLTKNLSADTLEYAESISADLIIITTEQENILSTLFIGTHAQQIIHHSLIPVLSSHPRDIGSLAR